MKAKPSSTAFGWPGIEPRWTHGNKDGVETAYAASSRIWFTLWNGIITEVYYPSVDHPQIRDLQYLVTDGKTFFHEEKRHLKSKCERLSPHALGYRITNVDPGGRYTITKEIIADPHLGCILQHTHLTGDETFISKVRLDRPERYMLTGRPTGSAMPLMWAHAEYIKLLRSVADGQVFDLIPEVAGRYVSGRNAGHLFEVWKQNRQVRRIRKGYTLRIQIDAPFRLHWTNDEWHTVKDTPSVGTTLGIDFVDVPIPAEQRAPIQFTFFWMTTSSWEGRD
jgi:glucodextranase-like protein